MCKKLLIILLAISITSCQSDSKDKENSSNEIQSSEFKDEHNAEIALDYIGDYAGELPCADCAFIRFKVAIKDDNSFYAKYIYEGKSDEVFQETGIYKWIENGKVIHLKAKNSTTEYKFKVVENGLWMLSQDGKEIESSFQEKYYLEKI